MPSLCAHCQEPLVEVTNDGGSWCSTFSMSLDCAKSPDGKHDPNPVGDPAPEGDTVTEQQPGSQAGSVDIQTLIQTEVAKLVGGLTSAPAGQSFEDALKAVDPADSEAALAMLDFLLHTGRLGRVGTLDGGQGYLFMYQEPKGSTKAGYTPGATQGDRLVDAAVEKQRESGAKPQGKSGMCPNCYSVVTELDDGTLVNAVTDSPECPNSVNGHQMS